MSDNRNEQRRNTNQQIRIGLYARRSTQEQDGTSIAEQFAACRRELKASGINLSKAAIIELSDAETQS